MRVTLTNGFEYRLYFRYHHVQSVLVKRLDNGKIDYNDSEIRTVKEPVVTEVFLSAVTLDDDDDIFGPAFHYRGIAIKSPEDVPNREIARVAAIRHMTNAMSRSDAARVWDAYFSRPGAEPRPANI